MTLAPRHADPAMRRAVIMAVLHDDLQRPKAEDSVRMLIDLVDNKLSCVTNDAFEEWVCENAAQNVSDCQLTGGRFTVRQFFARLFMRAVWAAVAERVH